MKKEKKRFSLPEVLSAWSVPVGGEAMIELHGNREMLLSGCTGITDYSPVQILLSTKSGEVTVSGRRLCLSVFRDDILSVSGKIEAVTLGARGDKR